MSQGAHVALLIETSREVGRGLLRGIARYLHWHGPWSIYFVPMGLDDAPPPWLNTWRGDGILARINNRRMAQAVLNSGVPAIDLRGAIADLGLPHVGVANRIVVRQSLDHLLDRGFRNFAFFSEQRGQNRFVDLRCEYFCNLVKQSGYDCSVLYKGRRSEPWEQQQQRIVEWLSKLPMPVGLMCSSDDYALDVLGACQWAGLEIPDQVAVISVDNDEYICRFAKPPLTSIDVNLEEIGYQASALMQKMMEGEKPTLDLVEVPPRGVVARRSTEAWALPDEQIGGVLHYIRDHACEGIQIEELLKQYDLSRSTLERRFKEYLGRTPKAEILRVQLERARNALARTNLSVAKVATQSGFNSISYFSAAFRRVTGLSPVAYRERFGKTD